MNNTPEDKTNKSTREDTTPHGPFVSCISDPRGGHLILTVDGNSFSAEVYRYQTSDDLWCEIMVRRRHMRHYVAEFSYGGHGDEILALIQRAMKAVTETNAATVFLEQESGLFKWPRRVQHRHIRLEENDIRTSKRQQRAQTPTPFQTSAQRSPFNRDVMCAIETVIDYLQDEEKDYRQNPDPNHIWNAVKTLKSTLESAPVV